MDLHSVVMHRSKLPTIPKVAQQVIASLSSADVSLSQIGQSIRTDPVLSMKILRLANSAFFQVSRTVESVDDALQLLGLSTVRNLALGNGLMGAYSDVTGLDLPAFWKHSLHTAALAGWLADRCDVMAEQAFTLGLIQGVGQLQLHVAAPAAMQSLDAACSVLDAARPALERDALGFDFGTVSAALARSWNIPPHLVKALDVVCHPLDTEPFNPLAAVVHLAYWHASEDLLAGAPRADPFAQALAQALGLAPFVLPPWPQLTKGMDVLLE